MTGKWETKSLGELCDFRNGLWKGKKPPYVEVGIIRNTNFTREGFLDDSDIAYHDVEVKQLQSRQLECGDLILEKSGGGPKQPVGRVIPFEKSNGVYSFSNFTSVIRIKDRSLLDYQFLHRCLHCYYISGVTESMQRRSTGIRNLDFKSYKLLQVPLPPIPEQKRIVAILDETFEAIAKAKENAAKRIASSRELFDSYLNGILSDKGEDWQDKVLADVCEKITDGTHQTPTYFDDGVIFLSSKNVKSGRIDWENVRYIDQGQHASMHKRVAPRLNDILLAKNGTTGVAAIVDRDVTFDIYVSLALLRAKSEILPDYLLHFVNSPVAKKQFNKRLKGIGVPNLHLNEIRQVCISFPKSHKEQRRLSTAFTKMALVTEEIKEVAERKISRLDVLKKSLLKKAFSGQLTSKSPELELVG